MSLQLQLYAVHNINISTFHRRAGHASCMCKENPEQQVMAHWQTSTKTHTHTR